VMMGLLTAIGGGVLRDVLVDRPTLLVQRDLYATPIVFGSLVYVALLYARAARLPSALVAIALIFGIRSAAIHWNLGVPDWLHVPMSRPAER
ncbi:MAG: trimeric intracellular cation channel family protein, partial [Bacteroidota bacterium]